MDITSRGELVPTKLSWSEDHCDMDAVDRELSTAAIYGKRLEESHGLTADDTDDSLAPYASIDRGAMNLADTLGWIGCTALVLILSTTLLLMGTVEWLPMPGTLFSYYIAAFLGIFTGVTIMAGVLHVYGGVNIAYTRKVAHFFSFFLPFGLYVMVPFEKTLTTYLLTFCCSFLSFVPLTEPIRTIWFMWPTRMAFASFDRPEDRPYTLFWAITQALAVYAVMICAVVTLTWLGHPEFAIIPLVITGFGDGLAEVVGRPFGKHKYRTGALCSDTLYTRSVEGSTMLVVTSVVVVTVMYCLNLLSVWQYSASMVLYPIPMAITEAVSMHSWDNAMLCLVGSVISVAVALIDYI